MPMDLLTFFSVLLRTCGSTRPPITPTASRCRKHFVSPAASCLGSMNGRSANVLSSSAEERYPPPHVSWFLICRFLFNFIIKLHKYIYMCACPQRRQLMRDGFVVDVCENGHNLRHLFLYTDMLLCARLTSAGWVSTNHRILEHMTSYFIYQGYSIKVSKGPVSIFPSQRGSGQYFFGIVINFHLGSRSTL